MVDFYGRPVSTNIDDRRYETPAEVAWRILQLSGAGWGSVLAPQPSPPRINLQGGPGPYRGEPLVTIETVRGRQVKPGMTLEQARAAPPVNSSGSFDDMYRRSGGDVFNFASTPSKPQASTKMAEWWQSPAYLERQAAGEVVTPGLIDWGGLVNAFNAPYNERVGRLPAGPAPAPGKKGDVTAYYNAGSGGPLNAKQDRYGTSSPDRVSAMESGQWPQPPMTAQQHLAFRDTKGIPLPRGGTGPAGYRLAAGVDGYDIQAKPGPQAPSLPNPMPLGLKPFTGTGPTPAGYTPGMRFASPTTNSPAHKLNYEPTPDDGQIIADQMGLPVKTPGGKVYQPKYAGSAAMPSGKVAPRYSGATAATPQGPQRSGGLLGMLFGGQGNAGGLFGGGAPKAPIGITVTGGNAAPAPAPTYTTTPFQEDRFQTTTGAQMPASMNNSRWQTGY
jgi:hypothetical protein